MVRAPHHRFCRSQSKFEIRQACYLKLFNCASLLCNYLFIRNALPIEIYMYEMNHILNCGKDMNVNMIFAVKWCIEQPKRLKNDDLSSLIFSVSSICSWKYDLFHIFQFINNNNNDNNDNNHHHHSMVMIRVTMIMMLMIIIIIMILKMKIIIIKKKQTFIKLLSNWKLNTNLE